MHRASPDRGGRARRWADRHNPVRGPPLGLRQRGPGPEPTDLEGVRSGVSASTSAYLFTHPDYNWFVTSLEGLPRDQVSKQMKDYLNVHPDVKNDITGIRQPLVDIKDRCGAPPSP
jgi:heme-binding protein